MDIQQEVRAAERVLATIGTSVRQFCIEAKIMPETWRFWRNGQNLPQLAKWQQAMRALEKLQNEHRRTLARKRAAKKTSVERATKPQP